MAAPERDQMTAEGTAQARPVTAEDRVRGLEGYADFTRRGGGMDVSRIPDTQPLFSTFFFGEDGTVWVKLTTGGSEPGLLDVFDGGGAYLGRVQAPPRMMSAPAPALRDWRMAAVMVDEDGVPAVSRMRIVKPAG